MKRGFTLIELLVVIAIIAILAAILFPVFARAREKARQTSCLNNGKQLCLAFQMYAQDYDETLPNYWYGASVGYWCVVIHPYIKNEQIFVCPSRPELKYGPGSTGGGGWGINYPAIGGAYVSLASIARPAETVLIGEIDRDRNQGVTYTPNGSTTSDFYRNARTDHNEGMNVGMVDGHAKWYKLSDLNSHADWYDLN